MKQTACHIRNKHCSKWNKNKYQLNCPCVSCEMQVLHNYHDRISKHSFYTNIVLALSHFLKKNHIFLVIVIDDWC